MNQSSARVFVRFACYTLIALASLVALLIVYLSQLDLNDYRLSLEQTMSSALKQPVQIGHSSLTFNRGLALALDNLKIGDSHSPLAVVPRVTATLKLAPLLKGELILDLVQIDYPQVKITLPFPERPSKGTSQQLLSALGIRILSIHNATIEVDQIQGDKAVQRLKLSQINALLRGWKPEKTGQLTVSGQLQKKGGQFLLEAQLPSSRNPEIWRNEEQQGQLKITNISTQEIPGLPSKILPELMEMTLNFRGMPATGAIFKVDFYRPDNNDQIFSLSGRWTSAAEQEAVTKLKGKLLKVPLSGEFYFIKQIEQHFLAGKIGADNVALTPEMLTLWQVAKADNFLRGQLDKMTFTVNESWPATELLPSFPRINAEIAISQLHWDRPEFKYLQSLAVNLTLKDETLEAREGTFTYNDQAVAFAGKINSLFLQPEIDAQFSFDADIRNALSQFTLPEELNISGKALGSLELTGLLGEPDFLLQVDLTALNFDYGTVFNKGQTTQSQFTLKGHFKKQDVQFAQALLTLNDATIAGQGYWHQLKQKHEFSFAAEPINLDKFRVFLPVLEKFQVQGTIQPSLAQKDMELQGTLKLENVSAHLTSVVADLNRTTGEMYFNKHGFTFNNLLTSLGKSDFKASGVFSNWDNPTLQLEISGEKIRAHDLIFSNEELTLYDLSGHIEIDAEGLSFSPVEVRLEDDTLAIVTGNVSDFSNPKTVLDIHSEQVDVLDIIDLFASSKGKETPQNESQQRPHRGPDLLIKAYAKQGTLGGLLFQNAQATIRSDHSRLTIYPLKFNNGEGWCDTRVEFDYNDEVAPLRVSGHVKNVDASVLHKDMFNRPGLVSGRLKGDFYLEGNPQGDQFWQGARGGIHAQISDGTLRKFHGLAKVFSLLNISQIFAGKLPDMDTEGMPFSLLEGSVQIGAGLLATEDLKITSEAMNLSAVGTHALKDDALDFTLGIMPLRTVDKVITSIPIAGWVLAGTDKALITAYFKITGSSEEPTVTAIPIDSVSTTVFGIFKRTFGLPAKLMKDIGSIFEKDPPKKQDP
ncbi:AsmA-like C-terminal region [Desulfuromusa kysingii]|uniref:AsmA-like C-terminal region n=1 Tax=Desulfuromusa kysingii TaxID=37625 RepID=A0A1H3WTR2_9BACT|nr:AsmA-like C-terminal domain-containing protein [Desulfuromusa kysingii]SDZ89578.1 AsmA-like C-terminal region [Desulfuromusa kysingii]